jgi:hypothetical protein
MKKLLSLTALTILMLGAACGSKTGTASTEKNASTTDSKTTSTSGGAASATVKSIYDNALKRDCGAVPAMLTENFRKEVGSSKDSLDALCDTFTDSGKLASFEVKSENLSGDSGTVKVALTFKDGKKQDKDERVKKSGDKWLMDS